MRNYIRLMIIILGLVVLGGCAESQNATMNSTDQTETTQELTQKKEENVQQPVQSTNLEESSQDNIDTEVTEMRLIAVGDNLMHRSSSLSGQQADGSWNYTRNFENVSSYYFEYPYYIVFIKLINDKNNEDINYLIYLS